MSRETKLGVVFIGILLLTFSALLVRKLTRPSNRGLDSLAAKPTDAASQVAATSRQPQAAPPTLVTPKTDSGKPPALAGVGERGSSASNSIAANPTATNATPWTSSQAANSPGVMASPIPIADLTERYADRSDAKKLDSTPVESTPNAIAAQPYRSGYGSANDQTGRSASLPTTSATVLGSPMPASPDPFQSRGNQNTISSDPVPAAISQNDWPKTKPAENTTSRTSTPAVSIIGTRQADPLASKQNDAGFRYSAAQPVDPFHRVAPQQLQPYAAQVVTGTVSDAALSNAWERPNSGAATTAASSARYGNATAAPPVATTSELSGPSAQISGISRDGDQYSVQPNDSYWTISEKAYGSGAFFKALHEHNRKKYKDADDLHVGQVLSVPEEGVLRRAYPDLCPRPRKTVASVQQRMVSASSRLRGGGHVYTVIEGDTLFEIARHELGKPARWGEIYELNREVLGDDFDYLRPGIELILPAGAEKNPWNKTAVRQPDSVYPR